MKAASRIDRSLTRQLTFAVVLIAAATLSLIAGFTAWSMSRVDDHALTQQTGFANFGLNEVIKNLPVEQTSSTTWDEAVRRVREGDQAWMKDNLTVWMASYFGHDRVYVLDPKNLPVQSMKDGALVGSDSYAHDSAVISPLVSELRAKMQAASGTAIDSTAAITDLGAEDIVLFDGKPAIVSVKPIIPDTPALSQTPGSEYLHVSVRFFGTRLISQIADEFALGGAHLTLQPEQGFWIASIPIHNMAGKTLGYIEWNRARPGLDLMEEAAPALALGLFVCILLGIIVLRRLRRSAVALEASEAQAHYLAFHDTLTGLPNRALFEDRLDQALANVRGGNGRLALLCLDLDRFKNINDTLGHPAGDELVRLVAQRLAKTVREKDTVARLGGDEFAIIRLGIKSEQDAEQLAQRIADQMAKPFELMGTPTYVTFSVGIALSHGEETRRDDMLRSADIPLYEAKRQGRARYQLFAGDMDDVVRQRRRIESDLRGALASGAEIGVAYQPLFSADCTAIVGAEALVRWDHPVHGRLPPELYIGIAEERGMIEQLGEAVLRQACTYAQSSSLPWVAVNVSPVQVRGENFVERILSIVAATGLSPSRLQLEITEGVLLEDPETTNAVLAELRDKGIRIALDDFGTGYSSMNYLRRYRVDKLKIDRSFISELGQSGSARAIVGAMVDLGRALGLTVTAEGVETEEQRDILALIGCHELQGYLMARPMKPGQLNAMLEPPYVERQPLVHHLHEI